MRANGLPSWLPAGDGVPGERTHPPRFGPLTWVLPGGAAAVSAAIPAPGLRRRGALRRSGPPCESESYAKHLGRVKPATFRDVRRGTERASGAVTMPDVSHTSSSRRPGNHTLITLRFAVAKDRREIVRPLPRHCYRFGKEHRALAIVPLRKIHEVTGHDLRILVLRPLQFRKPVGP